MSSPGSSLAAPGADARSAEGWAHHRARRFAEAEACYRQALAQEPAHTPSLRRLGVLALHRGRAEEAVTWLRLALAGAVGEAALEVRETLAAVHRRLGQPDQAAEQYALVTSGRPHSAQAHVNLGAALADLGDLPGAAEALAHAVRLDRDALPPKRALAHVLADLGRGEAAAAICRAGLAEEPDDLPLLRTLARACDISGRPDAAIQVFDRMMALSPDDVSVRYDAAVMLKEDGRTEEAVRAFRELVVRDPDAASPRLALCMAHLPGLYGDAAEVERRRAAYAEELSALARWAAERSPDALAPAVGLSQPFFLPYQGRNDRELQGAYGALVCRAMAAAYPSPPLAGPPAGGERIRIGFVSGFFRAHANWRMPIEGWVRGLDRSRFSLFGYHTGAERDGTTREAAALFDRFVQGPLQTGRWRDEIASDAPHVLIYPEVGMHPMSVRLAAQRLAPVQCASWGHPVTTGLPTIDYFLSSDLMEPADAQAAYTEPLVRLPGLSTRLHPAATEAPGVVECEPARRGDRPPVFWCGQSPFKYAPEHDDVLARIAARTPGSKFVFVAFPGSDHLTERFRERLANAFERRGATSEQIVMRPRLSPEAFREAMGEADVVLDSLGWSGCNTLMDALLQDLPVVSTPGAFMRGRHGAALLRAIGLGDMLCADIEAYVETAVRLARHPRLRRRAARRIRAQSPRLFTDADGAIAALELFIRSAVEGLPTSRGRDDDRRRPSIGEGCDG